MCSTLIYTTQQNGKKKHCRGSKTLSWAWGHTNHTLTFQTSTINIFHDNKTTMAPTLLLYMCYYINNKISLTWSTRLGSAPLCSNSFKVSLSPQAAATCSGVDPSTDLQEYITSNTITEYSVHNHTCMIHICTHIKVSNYNQMCGVKGLQQWTEQSGKVYWMFCQTVMYTVCIG